MVEQQQQGTLQLGCCFRGVGDGSSVKTATLMLLLLVVLYLLLLLENAAETLMQQGG